MIDDIEKALSTSLGNPERDFKKDPLTQEEIVAVIFTYERESVKQEGPEIRAIYLKCIEYLKKHLIIH